MGLIHRPKVADRACVVHDLRCLMENDNLLRHNLDVILRNPQRAPLNQFDRPRPPRNSSYVPPPSASPANDEQFSADQQWQAVDMNDFEDYPTFQMTQQLNVQQLLDTYTRQHELIDRALHVGEQNERRRSLQVTDLPSDALVDRALFEGVLSTVNFRNAPEVLASTFKRILSDCQLGDIIDVQGYRGNGYYLVTRKFVDDNGEVAVEAVKTLGEYGCHLPAEAWPYVDQHGVAYFGKADVWACYLPVGTEIAQPQQFTVQTGNDVMFTWLDATSTAMNEVKIDGAWYNGKIMQTVTAYSML